MGLPLATAVVPGDGADDPLDIPATRSVQKALGPRGWRYLSDSKMPALVTRAFVADPDDFYLCPLAEAQLSRHQRQQLLRPAWDGAGALQPVHPPGAQGPPEKLVASGLPRETDVSFAIEVERDAGAIAQRKHGLGREVYASNHGAAGGPAAGVDPGVPAGQGTDPRTGVPAEPGAAGTDPG